MPHDLEHAALLVVDLQKGFFSIPGFSVHAAADFLERVTGLCSRARSSGVPVIHVQHCGPVGHPLELGTEGHDLHPSAEPLRGETIIQKEDSDAFLGTDLQAVLQELSVTNLVVCGLQSEYCVDTTCRRAHALGYHVILVEDAHTTGDAGSLTARQIIDHHNETLGGTFVELRPAAEVLAQHPSSRPARGITSVSS